MKYFPSQTNVTEKEAKGPVNKVMISDVANIVLEIIDSSFKPVTAASVNTKDSYSLGAGEAKLTTITEGDGTETTERYEDIENATYFNDKKSIQFACENTSLHKNNAE